MKFDKNKSTFSLFSVSTMHAVIQLTIVYNSCELSTLKKKIYSEQDLHLCAGIKLLYNGSTCAGDNPLT